MYQPFDKENADRADRAAWILSEIIDDAAPLNWMRFRFAAQCIAGTAELMALLKALGEQGK